MDSELFEAVSSQADRIAEADGVDGARKVKLLSHLYNLTENRGGSKLHVLLRLFEVAAATGEAGKLTRFLAQVDTVAGRWGLCKADERRVLLSAAALASSTGDELRAQQLRISFLQTFHGEAELAAARTMAIKAAISYAQAPYASHNAAVVSLHAVSGLALSRLAATSGSCFAKPAVHRPVPVKRHRLRRRAEWGLNCPISPGR